MFVIVGFAIWASLFVAATELLDPHAVLDEQFPSCEKVGIVLLPVCRPELLIFDKCLVAFDCG